MADDDDGPPLAVQIEEDPVLGAIGKQSPIPGDLPVGVTVITGYLGAGKSTLVNHVLNAKHGKKIAVVLNEFGEEIGVERAMINEGEGGALVEEWVELANGCVCCTVKHSLVQALEQLVQRKERLDHILLETTGLANPAPLVSVLWLDEQLESAIRLDSIVTVVDAKNMRLQLDEWKRSSLFPEAFHQIAFADVIVINKVDLISSNNSGLRTPISLESLEEEMRSINSLAIITPTVRCQVDLDIILERHAYNAEHVAHFDKLLRDSNSLSKEIHHDNAVRTLCMCEEQKVDISKVRLWLEDILWEKSSSMDVYRCKGILSAHGSSKLHTLQAVREIYEIVPTREWQEGEKQVNKIVFIGRDLDANILRDSFHACSI